MFLPEKKLSFEKFLEKQLFRNEHFNQNNLELNLKYSWFLTLMEDFSENALFYRLLWAPFLLYIFFQVRKQSTCIIDGCQC